MSDDPTLNRYTVIERLRSLDFETPSPRCIIRDCGRPATWSLTLLCPSRHGSIMCGPHHDGWLQGAALLAQQRGPAVCAECPDHPPLEVPIYLWRTLL